MAFSRAGTGTEHVAIFFLLATVAALRRRARLLFFPLPLLLLNTRKRFSTPTKTRLPHSPPASRCTRVTTENWKPTYLPQRNRLLQRHIVQFHSGFSSFTGTAWSHRESPVLWGSPDHLRSWWACMLRYAKDTFCMPPSPADISPFLRCFKGIAST